MCRRLTARGTNDDYDYYYYDYYYWDDYNDDYDYYDYYVFQQQLRLPTTKDFQQTVPGE